MKKCQRENIDKTKKYKFQNKEKNQILQNKRKQKKFKNK